MQLQKPVLRQQQKLKLSPQLFQAIKLMSLPIQDLRLQIQEELDKNPALEVVEDLSTVSLEEVERQDSDRYSVFDETSDPGYTRRNGEEASNLKRQFIEGALTRPESLQEHLIWQLRLQGISDQWFRIGELLIRNLDENGFHREPPESLIKAEHRETLKSVMTLIQTFDPPGVCTADYKGSLIVQIHNHPDPHPLSEELVNGYLVLAEREKYGEISRKLKTEEQTILDAIAFIRTLDPMPGRNFTIERPRFVIPDVMVRLKDGNFVIFLNDEEIPVLGINQNFRDITGETHKKDKTKVRQFVSANMASARWFIRSIGQRNETLLKVCRVIVEYQREFFRMGPKYLVPLTLKDIAKEIDVHEATVSRITTRKHIQTEWGIFELKYFFSNSISGPGSSGSRYSKQGVKEIIKEIIEEEGSSQLTDKRIAEILANRGIKIARRTVTKYRKELDIRSSFQR